MSRLSLGRTFAIVLRQVYLIRGSSARVLPLFAWVAVDMVLWGFITRYLDSVAAPGLHLVFSLLGAVLLWDFLVRVMQGVTMAFLEDVWSRNFLNVFATPLSVTEYLAGLVVSSIGTSAVGLVVMLVLATTVFGLSFAAYGLAIVPALLILFACGIALGILGSAIVLRKGPSAEWFIWPLPAMLSPFAGVFYPVATLPAWMQAVAKLMPPAYVFEGMRAVVRGEGTTAGSLAWGGALAVVYVVAACGFFARIYRRAVRTGLLARYSAESVS
jgi:ABC-2 type transport system permease protein